MGVSMKHLIHSDVPCESDLGNSCLGCCCSDTQKGGIRTFYINLSRTDLLQLRQRDARTFLLKHKAQSVLLTGGEDKNRGPDEARGCAEGASGAGGAVRPCQPGWHQRPVQELRDALPSLNDLICAVLMFSRQTVTQLWQWLLLTSTRIHCRGQIVANLILTNVCLPFFWAVREDIV